ncbi:MAG: response regulator [Desulfobacterales bacterium]|nr:response regulator [Desulfobacterales bacterium]
MTAAIKLKPILVIDDEQSILNLLAKSLTKNGYTVDSAENGEKGIEKIESNNYSLIFTDLKMPGLSGKQVLQHLRSIQKNSTPIVGMSGTPWLLEQSDFDAVLAKPFSMKELLTITKKFVEVIKSAA